jgi:DNA (cytosine-5)-methyltransferase 1
VHGERFTLQKKARLFLILHRQPFNFKPLECYATPLQGVALRDYLDAQTETSIPPYILKRIAGGYRDNAIIYDPDQRTPVNLFANYKRDRSNYLIRDSLHPAGVRPFSVREVARLHGFPEDFQFFGNVGSQYGQIIDSVMVPVACAIGLALDDYFSSISELVEQPKPHGHRIVINPKPAPKYQQPLWEVSA